MKLAPPACSPQSAREARSPHVDFCAACPGTPISRLAPGLATQPRQLFSVPLPARSLFTLFTIQNSSDLDPAMQNATPVSLFRMNTCKSVSKQRTLTPFRMNTCEKRGEGGGYTNGYGPGTSLTEWTGSIPDTAELWQLRVKQAHAMENEQCYGRKTSLCL